MKSFKVRFALAFSLIFALSLGVLNLIEHFLNDKLTFDGAFFSENLTLACAVRVVVFLAVIVLSLVFARLSTKYALKFAENAQDCVDSESGFFDIFFTVAELAFCAYVGFRLYFSVKELNVTSTAFLIMGINDFTFELMLMRIFTYIANIIYALGGVCALAGCVNYAKQLLFKTTKKETD